MERGSGMYEDDVMEHACYHGRKDGRAAAAEWAAAFLAGTATMDELPEPLPAWVPIDSPDGDGDLMDHVARAACQEYDAANGSLDIPECYAEGYNAAVREVAMEHGITLPPGAAPCRWHTLVGPDMEAVPPTVSCEVCGYTEEADPDDVARQERILAELDK